MQNPRRTSVERPREAARGLRLIAHAVASASTLAALGLFITGCGQKGPLTLPKPPAGAASAAPR